MTVAANKYTSSASSTANLAQAQAVSAYQAAPTVAISGVPPNYSSQRPFTATFTFSEDIGRSFDLSDIDVSSNAGKSNFAPTTAGRVYTADITPKASALTRGGRITVTVAANKYTSSASSTANLAQAQAVSAYQAAPTVAGGPTIAITGVPAVITNLSSFTATFTFNEDITNTFVVGDITVVNGRAGDFREVQAGFEYTARITPTGGGNVGVLVAANRAQNAAGVGNQASETMVARNNIVSETQKLVRESLQQRAMLAIQMQPNLTGFLDGTILQGGTTLGNLSVNGLDQDTGEVDYFVSLGQLLTGGVEISGSTLSGLSDPAAQVAALEAALEARREVGGDGSLHWGERQGLDDLKGMVTKDRIVSGLFRAASSVAGHLKRTHQANASATPERLGYDGWVRFRQMRSTFGDNKSDIRALYIGGHRYFGDDFIVGLMGRLDWSDEKNVGAGNRSRSAGDGWMVGPYAVRKLGEHSAWIEAAAMWGKGDNQIRPTGTYEDQYDSERWYASSKLSGLIKYNDWRVIPSAAVGYYNEKQDDYTDSSGNPIGSQSAYSGEVDFGPSVMRTFYPGNGGLALTPRLGFSGVYNFRSKDTQSTQGARVSIRGWRAKLDGGLSIQVPERINVDMKAFYDGLGQSDYRSVGADIQLRYSW